MGRLLTKSSAIESIQRILSNYLIEHHYHRSPTNLAETSTVDPIIEQQEACKRVTSSKQESEDLEPEERELKIAVGDEFEHKKAKKPMAAAQFVSLNSFNLQHLSQQSAASSHQGGSQGNGNGSQSTRPVIERGASWSYNETRILLSLWGQDMVQRQLTNSKRTRHVWEKIADKIREHGFERTAGE